MPSSQNPYELLPACQTVVDRRRVGRFDVCLVRPADAEALLAAAVDEAPYWADLWPAASALAEVVARLPGLAGRRVVELGCGLALPSLVAGCAGADVLACDLAGEALALAAESGRLTLGRPLRTQHADLVRDPAPLLASAPFELVLAADVLYDPALADALARLLPRLLAPGGEAIVSYPLRSVEAAHLLGERLARAGLAAAHEDDAYRLLRVRSRSVRPAAPRSS